MRWLLAATIEEYEAYDRVCVASFGIRRSTSGARLLGWPPSCKRWSCSEPVRALGDLGAEYASAGAADSHLLTMLGHQLTVLTRHWLRPLTSSRQEGANLDRRRPGTMERLIDAGVDGIFTDRIDTLKDAHPARPVG